MKKISYCLILLLLITGITTAQDYSFVSIEKLIEQEVGQLVLPEIYKKLDLDISITPLPGKRAQLEATTGAMDGEIMRIFAYGDANPTTVRIPTPYYYLETMGFIKKGSSVVINSVADLGKYNLGKVRGVLHTDNITKGLDNVTDINDSEQMMKMLDAGRIDIALTNTVDGLISLKKLGITNITPLDEPLATLDLYHYLHISNKEIVSDVDNAINEMIKSGELATLIKNAEDKVVSK